MKQKEYDSKYNALFEKYIALQDERNQIIAAQNKNSKESAILLFVLLAINAFYMVSDANNINFFNLSLYIIPSIIQLSNTAVVGGKLKKCKNALMTFLIAVFIVLLITMLSHYTIDNGTSFKVVDTALMLDGLEIEKRYFVGPIFLNLLIPVLEWLAVYTVNDKENCDAAINVVAITSKEGN